MNIAQKLKIVKTSEVNLKSTLEVKFLSLLVIHLTLNFLSSKKMQSVEKKRNAFDGMHSIVINITE